MIIQKIGENKYTQLELLDIMQQYNDTDRQIIKRNLQIVKEIYNFQNVDIMKDFDYKEEKIKGWFNRSNPVIPIFQDALRLAVHYDFDITELLEKEEGNNMLKIFYLSDRLEDDVYERTEILMKAGHNKFKYNGNEDIIFKGEDQDEISEYLGLTMKSAENLKEYISCFDGGGYLQVTSHIQIGQDECIEILQDNFKEYENRIWNAQDFREEINLIMKEQMYKAFLKYIEEGFNTINNGNFKWK